MCFNPITLPVNKKNFQDTEHRLIDTTYSTYAVWMVSWIQNTHTHTKLKITSRSCWLLRAVMLLSRYPAWVRRVPQFVTCGFLHVCLVGGSHSVVVRVKGQEVGTFGLHISSVPLWCAHAPRPGSESRAAIALQPSVKATLWWFSVWPKPSIRSTF